MTPKRWKGSESNRFIRGHRFWSKILEVSRTKGCRGSLYVKSGMTRFDKGSQVGERFFSKISKPVTSCKKSRQIKSFTYKIR